MLRANYHTHTTYSDGTVSVEEIIQCAFSNDFDIIGISDHSPVHFPSKWNMKFELLDQYINDVNKAKQTFDGKITVLLGMEIDFFDHLNNTDYYRSYGLDYTIGSVHYLKRFPNGKFFNLDKSPDEFLKGLKIIYNDDIYELVSDYYQQVVKLLVNSQPDILAHLTLVEKFNQKLRLFDPEDDWYKATVRLTLDILMQVDTILEVNARSWYRNLTDYMMPPLWVLKEAYQRKIPITINGDVHSPQDFGLYWKDAIELVKAAGYTELTIITGKQQRKTIKID